MIPGNPVKMNYKQIQDKVHACWGGKISAARSRTGVRCGTAKGIPRPIEEKAANVALFS